MTDRNDHCPCGSGRKYKKCCLTKEVPFPQTLPRHVELRRVSDLFDSILAWEPEATSGGRDLFLDEEVRDWMAQMHAEDPDMVGELLAPLQDALLAEFSRQGLFDRYHARLLPPQIAYLRELATRYMRLWDVVAATPGVSIRLRDGSTGEEVEIIERSGSSEVLPGDRLAARVVYDAPDPTASMLWRMPMMGEWQVRKAMKDIPPGPAADREREIQILRQILRANFRPIDPMTDATTDDAIPIDEEIAEIAYRHMYHDWGEVPLPMFGRRTPREHARTDKGRREVLDLVREYQEIDIRMAREQGREPVDLSWVAGLAGLDPAEV